MATSSHPALRRTVSSTTRTSSAIPVAASANLRGAKARAGRARSKKKAIKDAALLERVLIGRP